MLSLQGQELMDDITRDLDMVQEISDAIANPVSFDPDNDEEELEAELEEILQEEPDREEINVVSFRITTPPPTEEAAVPARPLHSGLARNQVRSFSCLKDSLLALQS